MYNLNQENISDGLELLKSLPDRYTPLVFLDAEYRENLDALKFGNEGKSRGKKRAELPQMSSALINQFVLEIERVLDSEGHLALWLNKFANASGAVEKWLAGSRLMRVEQFIWNKTKFGNGSRARSQYEVLLILQKRPKTARLWKVHRGIPDLWTEALPSPKSHPHMKPLGLTKMLITLLGEGGTVVDPCAGGYGVLDACAQVGQHDFLGCDLLPSKRPINFPLWTDGQLAASRLVTDSDRDARADLVREFNAVTPRSRPKRLLLETESAK